MEDLTYLSEFVADIEPILEEYYSRRKDLEGEQQKALARLEAIGARIDKLDNALADDLDRLYPNWRATVRPRKAAPAPELSQLL